MEDPSSEPSADPAALLPARAALERGDYGSCERLLTPLLEVHGPVTPFGGEVRLLLATAHQGLGQEERAISCSRAAAKCTDTELRKQAQAMLAVLEAPQLQLPADRLVQLPQLCLLYTSPSPRD